MSSENTHQNAVIPGFDAKVIAQLGRDAASHEIVTIETDGLGPGLPPKVPFLFNRKAGEKESLLTLVEQFRLMPQRKTGTAEALTLESFCALVNRHKTEHSAIFAVTDWRKPSLMAVIDYHKAESTDPDHLGHRVAYQFPLSEEWKAWLAKDGEMMTQLEFASFIEDRIAELAAPEADESAHWGGLFKTTLATPSDLIGLSRGLQVHVDSRVKNVVTLSSGAGQIAFEETHLDGTGKPLTVPGLFMLAIAPFFNGEVARIPVRLRYRVKDGAVRWAYQIYRPDQFVTERIRTDLGWVGDETGLPVFEGAPEK